MLPWYPALENMSRNSDLEEEMRHAEPTLAAQEKKADFGTRLQCQGDESSAEIMRNWNRALEETGLWVN